MEIQLGDLTLHVATDGADDAPPILLLHGITSTGRTWDWFVPELSERYRVLRLDFRGHGRSGRAPGTYGFPGYVGDAASACQQVAGQPCIVMGHSLGGGTAAVLAQQQPALVRAVVLEDPPLGAVRELEDNSLLDGFRLMRESIPQFQESGMDVPTLVDLLAAAPSPSGPTFGELLHADALTVMADGMLALDVTVLDPVLDGTAEPAFDPNRRIPVPTLLITADPASPDAVTRPSDVEELAAATPDADVKVMTGAGHLVHDELAHRDAFRDAVIDFLDRLDAA
ncbi:MAG: alpha/beta hydrolase [Ilumatobacter sp.]|nr:MAG: alpha/beta hydrolase [Ilumatobacter sp.]